MVFEYFQLPFKRLSKVLIWIKLFRNDFRILSRPFQTAHFPGDRSICTIGVKNIDPGYLVIPTYIIDPLIAHHRKIGIGSSMAYHMLVMGRELEYEIKFKVCSSGKKSIFQKVYKMLIFPMPCTRKIFSEHFHHAGPRNSRAQTPITL